ncbi:MAG: dienelactone hydrolase family protein [Pseudomonadota bacterium]
MSRFVALVLIVSLFAPVDLFAEENRKTVVFEIPRAPLTSFQKARLPAGHTNPAGRKLSAALIVPPGEGRVPAVVLVRTCHDSRYYQPWTDRLHAWGYATLMFSRCQPPDFQPVDNKVASLDWKEGALAAYGALKFMQAHPRILPDRIGLIAWSRLGMIPLSVFNPEGAAQFFTERFAAAIAVYPFCSFARGPHEGPILVLSAGKDDWVDPHVCARMARLTANDRVSVEFRLYPDAVHGFDIEAFGAPRFVGQEINPDGFAAGGGTLGFSRSAQARAIEEVRSFLTRYLSPTGG